LAQDRQAQALMESKLEDVVKDVATRKSPRTDGIVIDFFTKFWEFLGVDFTDMV